MPYLLKKINLLTLRCSLFAKSWKKWLFLEFFSSIFWNERASSLDNRSMHVPSQIIFFLCNFYFKIYKKFLFLNFLVKLLLFFLSLENGPHPISILVRITQTRAHWKDKCISHPINRISWYSKFQYHLRNQI